MKIFSHELTQINTNIRQKNKKSLIMLFIRENSSKLVAKNNIKGAINVIRKFC